MSTTHTILAVAAAGLIPLFVGVATALWVAYVNALPTVEERLRSAALAAPSGRTRRPAGGGRG